MTCRRESLRTLWRGIRWSDAAGLALVLVFWAPPLQASEEKKAPIPVDRTERVEVHVAAPDAEEAAAFASELDVGEATSRGEDLAALLRRVPSARVRSYAGFGRYATLSLRGSTAEQVTVLVDGVVQNRALGGPVDLSTIPLTQVESVTVYRGIPPAVTGAGGMGGLVDIRTRAPEQTLSARVDLLAGSYDTLRASAASSVSLGGGRWLRLGFERIDSGGAFRYLSDNGTLHTSADDLVRRRVNNDLRADSWRASATLAKPLSGTMEVSLAYRRREMGVPGTDALPAFRTRLDEEHVDAALSWSWRRAGQLEKVELLADLFSGETRLRDPDAEISLGGADRRTRSWGGGVALLMRARFGAHALLLRGDLRTEDSRVREAALAVPGRGGARRRVVSLVVEDRFTVGKVLLSPSLRWFRRRDDFLAGGGGGLPPPAADLRASEWGGKLGIARDLGSGWTLRASAGHFLRVPSLAELFGDRGLVRGNASLRPERGDRIELGVSWKGRFLGGHGTGELVAHGTRSQDLIVFVPNAFGIVIAQNISAARLTGVEASAALDCSSGLSMTASFALMRATDRSGGFADGKGLVGRPGSQASLGLRWHPGRWLIAYDLSYLGSNPTDALNDFRLRLPARVEHDLHLVRELGKGWRLGGELRNLFDQRSRDVARFPLPGRTYYLHLGWRSEESP